MATICAGDQDGLKRINQEIATRYPRSEAAKQELADRLRRDYKYPTNADKAQMEAYRRAEAEQYGAWRKTWPQDSLIYNGFFSALVELPDTQAGQVARMGNELMAHSTARTRTGTARRRWSSVWRMRT